jgi:hypothetical protein
LPFARAQAAHSEASVDVYGQDPLVQCGRNAATRPQAQHSTERLAIVVEHYAMQTAFGETLTATGLYRRAGVSLDREA